MAEVDVNDDTKIRYVIRHYKFDSTRNQFRHIIVKAFDNKREFEKELSRLSKVSENQHGETKDLREHFSGIIIQPNHLTRMSRQHLIKRMIRHGVDPSKYLNNIEGSLYSTKKQHPLKILQLKVKGLVKKGR